MAYSKEFLAALLVANKENVENRILDFKNLPKSIPTTNYTDFVYGSTSNPENRFRIETTSPNICSYYLSLVNTQAAVTGRNSIVATAQSPNSKRKAATLQNSKLMQKINRQKNTLWK